MENKFKIFMKAVDSIENERVKKNCLSLVETAQTYYSYKKWHEALKPINSKLSAYSIKDKNKITLTDNYIMLMCYEYVRKADDIEATYTFQQFLKEYVYYSKWRNAKHEYHLFKEHEELKNVKYEKLIERAIIKFRRLKKVTDFNSRYATTRHNSLESAVNTYFDKQYITICDEETAFNAIYSEEFVIDVVKMIDEKSPFLEIMIAPVRRVLSSKEGKNNRHSECFDIKIDRSYEELKGLCNNTIKKYHQSMKNIVILNKWFVKLEKQL